MSNVVRIFIACAPDGQDAESQLALEHSLLSRSSLPVDIVWMRLSKREASPWYSDQGKGWRTDNWATPFSLLRYTIPEVCGFAGRAIYSDSDVIFRADIAELWNMPFASGKAIIAKSPQRLCVSLWDCAALKRHMTPISIMQRQGMAGPWKAQLGRMLQPFASDQNWNCIDGEGKPLDDSVKAVHYSDIATQPQFGRCLARLAAKGERHWFNGKPVKHPRDDLVALFEEEYAAALASGLTLDRYDQSPPFGPVKKRDLTQYHGGPRLRAPAA